jgi:hypothetical protein
MTEGWGGFGGAFDGGDAVVSQDGDSGRFDRLQQGAVEGWAVEMPAVTEGFAQKVAIGRGAAPGRAVAVARNGSGCLKDICQTELLQKRIDRRREAFSDGAAAAVGLLDEHGVDPDARQLERGARSGGAAAEHRDRGAVRPGHSSGLGMGTGAPVGPARSPAVGLAGSSMCGAVA